MPFSFHSIFLLRVLIFLCSSFHVTCPFRPVSIYIVVDSLVVSHPRGAFYVFLPPFPISMFLLCRLPSLSLLFLSSNHLTRHIPIPWTSPWARSQYLALCDPPSRSSFEAVFGRLHMSGEWGYYRCLVSVLFSFSPLLPCPFVSHLRSHAYIHLPTSDILATLHPIHFVTSSAQTKSQMRDTNRFCIPHRPSYSPSSTLSFSPGRWGGASWSWIRRTILYPWLYRHSIGI